VYCIDPHDLSQASMQPPPHAAPQVAEVGWGNLLKGLLLGGLQLLYNVAVVGGLGKVRPRLAATGLPSTTPVRVSNSIAMQKHLCSIGVGMVEGCLQDGKTPVLESTWSESGLLQYIPGQERSEAPLSPPPPAPAPAPAHTHTHPAASGPVLEQQSIGFAERIM